MRVKVDRMFVVRSIITGGALIISDMVFADWAIEIVDAVGNTGYCSSLALDGKDCPHFSYTNGTSGNLRYAHWTGSAWDIQIVDEATGDRGLYHSSIALDTAGQLHVSYILKLGDPWNRLKYAVHTGTNWQSEIVDTAHRGASIGLTEDEYPCIGYSHPRGLNCAIWNGSDWEIETVDTVSGGFCCDPSLHLNTRGFPCVSYVTYCITDTVRTERLKYAELTDSGWQITAIDSLRDPVGQEWMCFTSSSLALGPDDSPHVCYVHLVDDTLMYSRLKYARFNDINWEITTIDSVPAESFCPSLGIDINGKPHVSYYLRDHLQYACLIDSIWDKEIIDVGGVGESSIALDSNGYACVSYRYWSAPWQGELRYARKSHGTEERRKVPLSSSLTVRGPNPFAGVTTFDYSVVSNGTWVRLEVIDLTGRLVRTLANGNQQAGCYVVRWEGEDDTGRILPDGVYFLRFSAGASGCMAKMVVIR
jgi:hypothetical protein